MKKRAIALSVLILASTLAAPAADAEEDHSTIVATSYEREEARPSRSGGRLPLDIDHKAAAESVSRQYIVQHEQHTISLAEIEAAERKAEEERIEEEKRKEREAAEKERKRQEAEAAKKREAEKVAQEAQKQPPKEITPVPATPAPPAPTGSQIKDYALSKVGPEQFQCLNLLWEKESNWNHTAMNPSSGAYGIPQSLPGHKMASAGSDWQTNPYTQVNWGISYISGRHGTPCAAWAHSQQHNWY